MVFDPILSQTPTVISSQCLLHYIMKDFIKLSGFTIVGAAEHSK